MLTFSVEALTVDDASAIAQLFQRVWPLATEYPLAWRMRRMLSAAEIRQEMNEGYHYFGIRDKDRIVGVYKLSIGDEILGEHQAVDPDYQRKGLARLMYEQFLRFGCQLRKPNGVNILVKRKRMIAFVKSLGFIPVGAPYEQHPEMSVQKFIFYHNKE